MSERIKDLAAFIMVVGGVLAVISLHDQGWWSWLGWSVFVVAILVRDDLRDHGWRRPPH